MKIESEEFRQAILALDAGLKSGMENGRTFTEMEPEYIKQCHELLLSSARSDNWDEIADVIAFFFVCRWLSANFVSHTFRYF